MTAQSNLPTQIFLLEPRINEMEIVIDDRAVRMLRDGRLTPEEIRQVVATLKITNDLERMGDLAVNIAELVMSLAEMHPVSRPPELEPMVIAVRAMVKKSLGALIFRNVVLAGEVLESDDLVDRYRDQVFERFLSTMSERPVDAAPNLQLVLASRYLERLADPRDQHSRGHHLLGARAGRAARPGARGKSGSSASNPRFARSRRFPCALTENS